MPNPCVPLTVNEAESRKATDEAMLMWKPVPEVFSTKTVPRISSAEVSAIEIPDTLLVRKVTEEGPST